MSRLRFLIVGAGAALVVGGALTSVGAMALTASDTHGDTVSLAARTGCPHGPNGMHGQCVSAIASSKSGSETTTDTCTTANPDEDKSETSSANQEDTSEQGSQADKATAKAENKSEKKAEHGEDKTEKKQVKACEASDASNQ